jgi:phage shock protein A
MLDRLMNIIKSMFNKGMAKMETPEVLAEQAEAELEGNLKKITETLTSSIANEKILEQKVKKNSEDLAQWEKRAMMAVQQNNDDMARQCLAKKQELVAATQAYEAQLAEQKKSTAMLKEKHAEFTAKLREFRSKKSELLTRMNAGQAMEKANNLIGSNSGSSMDKWEQKIAEKEAMGQAMKEMNATNQADAQFKEWDKQAGLDDELAALKASMGNTGPKLIEAPKVDENVPMVIVEDPDENKKK